MNSFMVWGSGTGQIIVENVPSKFYHHTKFGCLSKEKSTIFVYFSFYEGKRVERISKLYHDHGNGVHLFVKTKFWKINFYCQWMQATARRHLLLALFVYFYFVEQGVCHVGETSIYWFNRILTFISDDVTARSSLEQKQLNVCKHLKAETCNSNTTNANTLF